MKNRLLPIFDKIMLSKRAISERVVDQLKNISQIEHSRHRSVANCFVNLLAGLVAYTWREKKPTLGYPYQRAVAASGADFLSPLTSNSRYNNLFAHPPACFSSTTATQMMSRRAGSL